MLNVGNGGWTWNGLLPYFKKSETYTPPLPEDRFPNPSPTRRALGARDEEESIPIPFFDSADAALNLTALNIEDLLAAAALSSEGSSKRDLYHGSSGPVKASHNTWYSDIASPFIHTMTNLGIQVNDSPVRL